MICKHMHGSLPVARRNSIAEAAALHLALRRPTANGQRAKTEPPTGWRAQKMDGRTDGQDRRRSRKDGQTEVTKDRQTEITKDGQTEVAETDGRRSQKTDRRR